MTESPTIRPGRVDSGENEVVIVANFRNSSQGNLAIQRLLMLGIAANRLGVTPPDRVLGNQGMILVVPGDDPVRIDQIESLCRSLGADVHRGRP